MKKLALLFLFLTAFLPLIAQNYVTVQGTVTDISNGAPIVNHPVTIQTDSSSGFFVYNVVYTGANGMYLDTIFFNTGVPTSNMFVSTYDCNQNYISVTLPFGPGNQHLVHDFQICNSPSSCVANFSWQNPGNLSVQFTDLSQGGVHSTTWQFGDGTSSYLPNPLHTFSAPGTYPVMLSISDSSANCHDSITQYVIVIDTTGGCNAMFYAVPDSGNTMNIHFYNSSTGNNIVSWFWNFGDGTYSGDQNPVHLYIQPQPYYVCITIQSNDSTCFSSHCDTVFVNGTGGCQAQFTWHSDSTNLVQFSDLSLGATSWYWNFGDSLSGNYNISTAQNPSHLFSTPGIHHVCLTITNQNGTCQNTWCVNVYTGGNSGCSSYFSFSQNALTVAFQGYTVNGFPANYSWSFGDGTAGTGPNVTHTYASTGIYYVSLTTVTDTNNCTYTSGQNIPVGDSSHFNQIYGQAFENNFPMTSGIAMIFSIDSTNNLPYNDVSIIDSMGLYSFNYVPQGNFVVWVIPFDSINYLPTYYGDVITWQQATIISLGVPSNPYNIHMVHATNGSSGNGQINGHINTAKMTSGLTDKIRMILLNEAGSALEFRNMNSNNSFSFPTLAYGVYFLRAELPGCTSDLVRIEITQANPVANVVMTFSGKSMLGINENQAMIESLSIFPNPVTDQLTLTIVSKKDAAVQIGLSDLSGRLVISESWPLSNGGNTLHLNTGSLQPGLFILKITSSDGTNLIRKVIKTE